MNENFTSPGNWSTGTEEGATLATTAEITWEAGDDESSSSAPPYNVTKISIGCQNINRDYDIVIGCISGACFLFGILYCFFGYRFFKATMFLTGFIFGSLLSYLVCLNIHNELVPLGGKVGISLGVGLLCGMITMMVQYVGLFLSGFNMGLLVGLSALVLLEQFQHPWTKWIPIGVLSGCALVSALSNLYFQRGQTILATSFFGGALIFAGADYFVELFLMLRYLVALLYAEVPSEVCWFSWVVLGIAPLGLVVGTVLQWKVTGKGFDHKEAVRVTRPKRRAPPPVVRQRSEGHAPPRHSSVAPPPRESQQSRYRQLYQIRRVNGDVISQSYIKSIQHKLSPSMRLLVSQQQGSDDEGSTNQSFGAQGGAR